MERILFLFNTNEKEDICHIVPPGDRLVRLCRRAGPAFRDNVHTRHVTPLELNSRHSPCSSLPSPSESVCFGGIRYSLLETRKKAALRHTCCYHLSNVWFLKL
jgi:hypothetical protein